MSNKILLLIWGILTFAVLTPLRVAAQFYDSDNEVRIYVLDYVIDNPGKPVVAFVMNFNGSKGAIVATTGSSGISTPSDSFTENYYFTSDGNRVVELYGSNFGKSWNRPYTR